MLVKSTISRDISSVGGVSEHSMHSMHLGTFSVQYAPEITRLLICVLPVRRENHYPFVQLLYGE